MEDTNKIILNSIEQAVFFSDTQEFSFYLTLNNIVSIHFSKTGQTLLYEVPYNDANSIFPSHIRPSLLLSYSTTFQNKTAELTSPPNEKQNSLKNTNNNLKQPTIISKQKTKFILSKYKDSVKEALNIRNTYSPYPYFPIEWIINENDNWFRTNSKLEYVHWPFISLSMDNFPYKIEDIQNDVKTRLFYKSLFQKLNITITPTNTTVIQSLDKYVTITVLPHYQIFQVRYPIYLGKFSNQLFQYTHSKNTYNDSYNGQYVYYYITQEFSIKDIPEWCHYPLWLFQCYKNVNLSISNPIEGMDKKDMIIEKLPQTSFLSSNDDTILQSPPDFQNQRPIKLLYTSEAIYRLLPTNEIEIKVNEDGTLFRTLYHDMTYLSMYLPERNGQEDILKWKGVGRTYSSIITNHISNKRYPLQKFLHQALILYQSNDSSISLSMNLNNNDDINLINKPLDYRNDDENYKPPFSIFNDLDEKNIIPISKSLSSKIQEHLTINDNDFWAYADGRIRVVFSDRVIVSMRIDSDQCEVIQRDGEKIIFRISRAYGFEYYIRSSIEFAKWAFSTKTYRETEKLKKIQIKNKIQNEIRRNEIFLHMTDYLRLQRYLKNDEIITNLDNIIGKRNEYKENVQTQCEDTNYMKLSDLLTNITEKNKKFLLNSD